MYFPNLVDWNRIHSEILAFKDLRNKKAPYSNVRSGTIPSMPYPKSHSREIAMALVQLFF